MYIILCTIVYNLNSLQLKIVVIIITVIIIVISTKFIHSSRHGGSGSAEFASKNMIRIIEETIQWNEYVKGNAQDVELLQKAITLAFFICDDELRIKQGQGKETSGCTSVTAMITPRYIVCANAGDSRCVMGLRGVAKFLSEDHKPYDDRERRRIEAAGGNTYD